MNEDAHVLCTLASVRERPDHHIRPIKTDYVEKTSTQGNILPDFE